MTSTFAPTADIPTDLSWLVPDGSCAIYVRQSKDVSGERAGVRRQLDECRSLADRRGWSVGNVYDDNDISASGKAKRPGYLALLEAIADGTVTQLVAWHPDRLHRSPRELEGFIDLVDRMGTSIDTVSAGPYDLTTPAGRMTARIVGATARYEGEQKAARHKAKIRQLAAEGAPVPSGIDRCYGYSRDGASVVPAEAAVIRDVVVKVLAGQSIRSIARQLNEAGTYTTNGNPWACDVLTNLIKNPRLAAYRIYEGTHYEGKWPAILDRETHDALNVVLDPVKRITPNHGKGNRTCLLVGFLTCGLCGQRLRSSSKTGRGMRPESQELYYSCLSNPGPRGGCGRLTIIRGNADAVVKDAVFFALLNGRTPSKGETLAADTEALSGYSDRLAQLEDDYYVKGTLSAERFEQLSAALKANISESKSHAMGTVLALLLKGVDLSTSGLESAWQSNDLDWRRQLVAALIESVEVSKPLKPGRGSKAIDRMGINWLPTA